MIVRNRLALSLAMGLALSACASGGAGTGTTGAGDAPPADEAQGRTFPPGTSPSNNVWTRSAQVYLDRADQTNYEPDQRAAYEQALEQALQSVENEPDNPLGYYQAGVSYLGLGQGQQAAEMFDRAVEIYPRYTLQVDPLREREWIRLYNEAVSALQAGNEDLAIERMRAADAAYAGRPEARTNLAVIYTNRGDYDQAIQYYRGALEILQGERVEYLSAEDRAEWAEMESNAIFNLAQVLTRTDRSAEAIQLYQDYLAENPDDAAVKVQLALALSRLDRDAEAAELFADVLSRQDLTADQYYQVGVGLFNASRFEGAVTAFERAVAANPYFRDAVYNLAQALLARSGELADDAAARDEYLAVNERLIAVAEQLREADPLNRNVLAILAGAYRTMADANTGAASDRWRNQLVQVLESHEEMPYEVAEVTLTRVTPTSIRLSGQLTNLNAQAGSQAGLRFSLLNASGTAVATQQVTVDVPVQEQSTTFSTQFDVQGDVAGWSYEHVQ